MRVTPTPAEAVTHVDALSAPAKELTARASHLYARQRWLELEREAHPGSQVHVHVEHDGSRAVGAAYRFDVGSNPWPAARLDLFVAEQCAQPPEATATLLPAWLLGGRRPGHTRVLTAGLPAGRREVLRRLVAATAEHAVADGAAAVAGLSCARADLDLALAFSDLGAVRLPSPGLNRLQLPDGGWEGWLTSLPRKRRSAELADARKLCEGGVQLSCQPLRSQDVEQLLPLELALYEKYGHDYRHDEADRLHRAYVAHLGADALLVRAERDGALIGFASLVRAGSTAYVRQAGFDAAACEGLPVYFGAVYQEPVRWAAAAGVRTLDLSTSMDDVKRRRGAVTWARDAWVLPLTGQAQAVLRGLGTSEVGGSVEAGAGVEPVDWA